MKNVLILNCMNNELIRNSGQEQLHDSPHDTLFDDSNRRLVLFNDEVNTFDFIIEALIDVCDHSPEQAEQCAMIAHLKGKCVIKEGPGETIKKMAGQLTTLQITVEIN